MARNEAEVRHTGPAWAWDLIWETIRTDMESGAFDPALRRDLSEAYHVIEVHDEAE